MEDGYLKDVMSSNERIMFNDGIVAWINYHISFSKNLHFVNDIFNTYFQDLPYIYITI